MLINNAYDDIIFLTTRIVYWEFPKRSYPQTADNDPKRMAKRII